MKLTAAPTLATTNSSFELSVQLWKKDQSTVWVSKKKTPVDLMGDIFITKLWVG